MPLGFRFSFAQHTRWYVRMQRYLAAVVLLWLIVGSAAAAQAPDNYPGGFSLMPIDPGQVRLLSMTVDASIHEDGSQVFVDVQAAFRVHNQNRGERQTLTVAFPGYAVDGPQPEQVSLTVAGREVAYSAAATQWWVADIPLQADERLSLVLSYSVPLGSGPFVHWRYPLDLVSQEWPGVLESARVTLGFSEPPNPQSWLQLTPETYKLTAESITWSYDTTDPTEPIDYVFMRPSLWTQLRDARKAMIAPATGGSQASAIALGDVYTTLASSAGDPAIFQRYFPLAVVAIARRKALTPTIPTPIWRWPASTACAPISAIPRTPPTLPWQ